MSANIDPIYHYRKKQELEVDKRDLTSTIFNIELNVCEICNRRCVFCVHSEPERFANNKNLMSVETARLIAEDLGRMAYGQRGQSVSIAGFGEPLLNGDLEKIVETVRNHAPDTMISIITNGDLLTAGRINALTAAGADMFEIDLYDGPDQAERFESLFSSAGQKNYLLRHHYFGKEKDYGLTLNNWSGAKASVKNIPLPMASPCHIPFYKMFIDYNGDFLLCCVDWGRRGKIKANIRGTSISEFWLSEEMKQYRLKLIGGRRDQVPCRDCDIIGTLHGQESFDAFKDCYGNQPCDHASKL